jgi:type I restriction-modification system DNA methylase subunit
MDTYRTGDWRDTIWNCLEEKFPVKFEKETAKKLDQFFTPRVLCDMMYYMLDNVKDPSKINDTQLDPCCGAGNIIIASFMNRCFDFPYEPTLKIVSNFYGNELDQKMVDICRKRLIWASMKIAQMKGESVSNPEMYIDIVNRNIHCGDVFNGACTQVFDSYAGFDRKSSTAYINTEKGIYGWQQNMKKQVPYLFFYGDAIDTLPKMSIEKLYEAYADEVKRNEEK